MVCGQGHTRRLQIRRAVCLFVELLSFVEVPPSVTFAEVLDLLVLCHEREKPRSCLFFFRLLSHWEY